MSNKKSTNDDILELSTEETSIIALIPCEYDSSQEEDYANPSQDSIDSSELVDDSDDEVQFITEAYKINENSKKIDEKSNIKNCEAVKI